MTLGAGIAPAGVSNAGAGAPVPGASPAPEDVTAARLLDPATADYATDANGALLRMAEAPQAVYLALATIRGSSALADLGIDELPKTIGADIEAKLRDAVTRALSALVRAKVIAIVSITVRRISDTRVDRVVRWLDLLTRREQESIV